MADKINKSDLFGDLDLNAEIKALKELLGIVKELQEETKKMAKNKLSEVAKIDASTIAGIKKLMKEKEEAQKIEETSIELDKEQVKLKERLAKAQSEQGKETAKLRLEIQEQNKANKEQAKTELGLLSTYQEESKRLNEMRKRVKNLLLEKKKLTKEDHKELKLLAAGRPHVFIVDQNDNVFLMGKENGADVTAGTVSTGNALGDFNGYNLTFTAMEKDPANFVEVDATSATFPVSEMAGLTGDVVIGTPTAV